MGQPRRPHVALLVLGFPPGGGSGTYRGLGTANHLVRLGWDVTVLTVEESFLDHVTRSRDDSLTDRVDPRVEVVRVPMRQQHLVDDMREWGWFRGNFRQLHDDLWNTVTTRVFPERYAGWIPGLVSSLRRVHRRHRLDVVLASGNPWSTFAAAWAFHRLSGVPYVMEYRDAWTLDMVAEQPQFPPGHPAWTWERRMIRSAARTVFVNDGLAEWYAARYPEVGHLTRVVHNGYDPDVVTTTDPGPRAPGPLRFGFVGTITELHPHEVFWAGWQQAREQPVLHDATFDIYGRLGYFARSRARIAALLPDAASSGVTYHGPVPKQQVDAVYAGLDVLVLLIAGGRYITSGKVFENLVMGKPMVMACDPASDAVNVSRGHPLVHVLDALDPAGVAAALVAAAEQVPAVSADDVARGREVAARFERGRLVEKLDAELREVVRGG